MSDLRPQLTRGYRFCFLFVIPFTLGGIGRGAKKTGLVLSYSGLEPLGFNKHMQRTTKLSLTVPNDHSAVRGKAVQ